MSGRQPSTLERCHQGPVAASNMSEHIGHGTWGGESKTKKQDQNTLPRFFFP